jgi:MFS family permease
LIIALLIAIIQVSPAFLILRTQEIYLDKSPSWWPDLGQLNSAIFAVFGFLIFNIVYALSSTSFGSLSDKYGRIPIMIFGIILLINILILFGLISFLGIPELAIIGMALFGLYIASTEGIIKAFIADLTKGPLILIRGKAYGWYNLLIGLTILISSILFGLIWDIAGASFAFILYGLVGIFPLFGLIKFKKKNDELKGMSFH